MFLPYSAKPQMAVRLNCRKKRVLCKKTCKPNPNWTKLNKKYLKLKGKKGSFIFIKYNMCCTSLGFLFVTLKPRPLACARNAFTGWYIITAPHECFPDTNRTLCSKAVISWKQSIHCFLKEHHELWKSNHT